MSDESRLEVEQKPLPKRKRWWIRAPLVSMKVILVLFGIYVAIVGIGLFPINRDFVESPDGVEIFVTSNAVHSDLIFPISNSITDWRNEFGSECFQGNYPNATHLAVGWGDRGFFIETPTWSDLKLSTAGKALLIPSETAVHVCLIAEPIESDSTRSIRISHQQYRNLIEFVNDSFELDQQGRKQQIAGACYGTSDAFFVGRGRYHCLNTCNCWTGNGLAKAGVTTGWLTPMPKTVFWYFPTR